MITMDTRNRRKSVHVVVAFVMEAYLKRRSVLDRMEIPGISIFCFSFFGGGEKYF